MKIKLSSLMEKEIKLGLFDFMFESIDLPNKLSDIDLDAQMKIFNEHINRIYNRIIDILNSE